MLEVLIIFTIIQIFQIKPFLGKTFEQLNGFQKQKIERMTAMWNRRSRNAGNQRTSQQQLEAYQKSFKSLLIALPIMLLIYVGAIYFYINYLF